jgi:MFS family permease
MIPSASKLLQSPTWPAAWPFYYGWVNVALASLAMTATLAGRTHGLGLISKPLLEDLQLGESRFSLFNFWAIILGSLFCLPAGRLIDRWGTRPVSTLIIALLGVVVMLMSGVKDELALLAILLLVRGLGQGALSVVSMAMVGKWFQRRLGPAMGVYAVLVAVGFIASVLVMGSAVLDYGWRPAWRSMGLALVVLLGPICWILVRSTPESCGLKNPDAPLEEDVAHVQVDLTLGEALRTPAFWVVSLGTSLFGLIWSAITLFNQSILEEHGFDARTFLLVMAILTGSGLISNLAGGWLASRVSPGRLLGTSMLVLAGTLLAFPVIRSAAQLMLYALVLGVAGGMITVIFFAFYGQAFGRSHLGRIQGAAQVLSVLASALGPVLLTLCKDWTGSYDPIFIAWAPVSALLGIAAWQVRLPRR